MTIFSGYFVFLFCRIWIVQNDKHTRSQSSRAHEVIEFDLLTSFRNAETNVFDAASFPRERDRQGGGWGWSPRVRGRSNMYGVVLVAESMRPRDGPSAA
jgi:hypothetical protein